MNSVREGCSDLLESAIPVLMSAIVSAHGAVGARPWGDGRSPMGRWAIAHGAVGADYLREKIGKLGFGNENYRILTGKVR